MTNIACPNCHNAMVFDPSLSGKMVACPHCSAQIVIPAVGTVGAGRPHGAPQIRVSNIVATRFKPSTSLLDLFFDFRFERYVTPRIIRTTWVVVLMLGMLGVAFVAYRALAVWLPKSEDEGHVVRQNVEFRIDEPRDGARRALHLDAQLVESFARFTAAVGIALALLWVRVALETMIVIFNIAESLASIDKKTKG